MADSTSCEYFERNWAGWSAGALAPDQREALEQHRHSCPYCRSFGADSMRVRTTLQALPSLNTSPQFAPILMRRIKRLEGGGRLSLWGWEPRFHPVALSAGFGMALILGFLLLRPANAPFNTGIPTTTESLGSQTAIQKAPDRPASQRQIMPGANSDLLALHEGPTDTVKHRLPETPGQQKIPIPVEDDLWRLNQASTTPPSP